MYTYIIFIIKKNNNMNRGKFNGDQLGRYCNIPEERWFWSEIKMNTVSPSGWEQGLWLYIAWTWISALILISCVPNGQIT